MSKYQLYFHTLKHMKVKQVNYRLFYILRSKFRRLKKFSYPLSKPSQASSLILLESISSYSSYKNKTFTFLNLSHRFDNEIDWNFLGHGKLWAYNLNYFEYLNQKDFDVQVGLNLIYDFIDAMMLNKQGLEPFPISLRGINWIKFLTYHGIRDKKIDNSLYAQYEILADNLEYHLLGNHLLENGYSLLFGAYYFNDKKLFEKAKEILIAELNEEILSDGAHFELSVMYHQLMLFRQLDCINLLQNNENFRDDKLIDLLEKKVEIMLSWLKQMSFKDGSIPHFNDSADGISPTTDMLYVYAKRLGISYKNEIVLKECGYRAFDTENYELRVDVGKIGPSYILGHAHSDTFNFELRVGGHPFIVDSGTSTYENSEQRYYERSTEAHNTVKIANINQSQVWSSFRVAKRAHILSLYEYDNKIVASHDGYKALNIVHERTFESSDAEVSILDKLIIQEDKQVKGVAYLHFHPLVSKIKVGEDKIETNYANILIKGSKSFHLDDFTFANGFNRHEKAKVLKITFENELLVNIVPIL